jgi:hypothetical protein
MSIHNEPFDGAGRTYKLDVKGVDGTEIRVEDWWDRVSGGSWQTAQGNPAALHYAIRTGLAGLGYVPPDDEVVYGKIGGLGHLVHVSELGEPAGGAS